jgi:hypothetical protein
MVVDHAEGTPPRRRRAKKLKQAIAAIAVATNPPIGLAAGAK